MFDAFVIIVSFDLRFSWVSGSFRYVFEAGQRLGQVHIDLWAIVRNTWEMWRVYSRFVRFIYRGSAECAVDYDLAPGHFDLEFCA